MSNIFHDLWVIAVLCTQWGDTGKGKVIDKLASWADIIARGTGGANAGHTIVINGVQSIFHLIPSGIMHTKKTNIIGRGVAVDPRIILNEMAELDEGKIDYSNLLISLNAHLVLPVHLVMDRVKESGKNGIGTTGRGIGPLYTDHYFRTGLRMYHLLNPDLFRTNLKRNLIEKVRMLSTYDPAVVREIMQHEHLLNGAFYQEDGFFNVDAIIDCYMEYGKKLQQFICDTEELVRDAVGKKHILLEGAQGYLLSVDYGSYPHVTSSDPSVFGIARGVGISPEQIDRVINIAKAFYMTRVGDGPFPTEFGGERSARHCRIYTNTATTESNDFSEIVLDPFGDEFFFGVEVRKRGKEYGATTGRPRRCGWLDLTLLRSVKQVAGKHGEHVALTKIDVLDKCPTIRVCVAYLYDGPDVDLGDKVLKKGDELKIAITNSEILEHCKPIYEDFPGWMCDISQMTSKSELPPELIKLIEFVEKQVGVTVDLISVGPERDQTIFM